LDILGAGFSWFIGCLHAVYGNPSLRRVGKLGQKLASIACKDACSGGQSVSLW
jgi:hypothetical protein